VERKTDLEMALAAVMLLGVILYFVVPGAIAGLAANTGSSSSTLSATQPSLAPSSGPTRPVVGGLTLAPASKGPTASESTGDTGWISTLLSASPSVLPPDSQPTSGPNAPGTTHGPSSPDDPPRPQPTVIRPTRPTPQPTSSPKPTPKPTPTPTPTPTPQSQSVTFVAGLPATAAVGESAVVDASASSGLAVTLPSATPAVCTLSGSTVTFVSAGQCTIEAAQAGDTNWAPASASQSTIVS